MTQPALIVGAGLAGLIAAHAWPRTPIVEASPEPLAAHKALLRFRSGAVGELTGIEFTKVKVHKGIWYDGAFVAPSIAVANMYTQKVATSLVGDRSIWNIDPVERWIAPDDLYEQLLHNVRSRVAWGVAADLLNEKHADDGFGRLPVITTMPLGVAAKQLGLLPMEAVFPRAPIEVRRCKIPGANVYQTVYFPEPSNPLYRASITRDTLICEFMASIADDAAIPWGAGAPGWQADVIAAFGLNPHTLESADIEVVQQKYGKIAPINDAFRRKLLFDMTQRYNVFSLGRFATWRNILLDDVVHDIAVIKRLMRHADGYQLRREA